MQNLSFLVFFFGNIYEVGLAHSVNDVGSVVNYILPLMLLLHYCFARIICHLKEEIVCLLGFFFLLSGCPGLRIDSLQVTPKLAGQNQSFLEICGFFSQRWCSTNIVLDG